jgi:hypothetical protein
MFLELIVTVLLVLCSLSMFITGIGKMSPLPFKLIPLLAAAVYWIVIAIRKSSGKTGIAGVLLLVIFYFLVIITIPSTVMIWMGYIGDREKNIPAITIGEGPADKTIYIVYHTGITPFLTNKITEFAGKMGKSGYKTVLYCANKELTLDLKNAAAVGFASPIYLGMIRPPVNNFIMKSDLKGIKSFIFLTSGGAENMGELDRVRSELEKKGASVMGMEKFSSMEKTGELDSKMDKLSMEIEDGLHKK